MMQSTPKESTAREAVLDIAEQEFMQSGYKPVTLDVLATKLGMKKASLYYHAPGGKEDLFMAVMSRCMERHRKRLSMIVEQALPGQGIRETLVQIGRWFLSQPPLHTSRLLAADLPLLDSRNAAEAMALIESCIAKPVRKVFKQAKSQGRLNGDMKLLMGIYFNLMESLHEAPLYTNTPQEKLLQQVIDVFMYGAFRDSEI
jgi:AcrR family transcriptional regulator